MKEQSVTKGFAILSAAGIFVKILSLLYIPFLLAIIGEEGYGIYYAAYQVYVFVYVLTNSGVPVAISKLVSELTAVKNYRDAVRSFKIARFMLLILGVVMTLLMFATAPMLSKALHFEKSTLAILALSPTLLFTAVASAYRGYFQGRGNMTPTAVSQIIEQIINTIFTLVFAGLLIKVSLEAACAGGTVGTSLGALFSAVFLIFIFEKSNGTKIPPEYRNTEVPRYTYGQLVKKILGYSIPITLSVGMQYAGNLVDLWNTKARLLAAGITDTRATELYGYLSKYQQLMNAPISVIVALATAILPAVSAAVARQDRQQTEHKINYAFRLCLLIAIPSAVGFAVLSRPAFDMLKFGGGAELMLYGSIVLVLMGLVQIQSAVLQGAGRLYTVTFYLVLGILGKIATNYFVISIPRVNIYGAIVGSIVGISIPLVLNLIVIRKLLKVRVDLITLSVKPLMASVVMGASVFVFYTAFHKIFDLLHKGYISNALAVIIAIFAGVFVYPLILILIKGITKEDLESLPAKITGLIPGWMLNLVR